MEKWIAGRLVLTAAVLIAGALPLACRKIEGGAPSPPSIRACSPDRVVLHVRRHKTVDTVRPLCAPGL